MAKAAITTRLLSRSPGKNGMDRLKARKTPLHRAGLTLSPSRVVNRAAQAHALRSAGRQTRGPPKFSQTDVQYRRSCSCGRVLHCERKEKILIEIEGIACWLCWTWLL
jgi:hypothetical protein